jgi:hypothetical protein
MEQILAHMIDVEQRCGNVSTSLRMFLRKAARSARTGTPSFSKLPSTHKSISLESAVCATCRQSGVIFQGEKDPPVRWRPCKCIEKKILQLVEAKQNQGKDISCGLEAVQMQSDSRDNISRSVQPV